MHDDIEMSISDMPALTLMRVVQAVAAKPDGTLAEIGDFAGYRATRTRQALRSAVSLGLLRNSSGRYACAVEAVQRSTGDGALMLIFRESLQGYRPFEVLCEGLSLGETVDEALRRARVLLGLRAEQETKFATLIRWGNEAGILEASDGRVTLATEVHPQSRVTPTIPSASDLNSAMKVRLYNSALLGQSCNQFIDEIDRALLADALMKVNTNPRGSAGASGQALEDFLREVATERGLSAEAKKCSGAGQLAGMLCSKSVIHSHHQKLVESSSTVRNATSHKKDKASLAPWEITSEGALSALLGAMTAMRSIYEYVYDGRQRI